MKAVGTNSGHGRRGDHDSRRAPPEGPPVRHKRARPAATEAGQPDDELVGLRVLLVDDHKLFAEAIAMTLKAEGIEVALAQRGDEALEMLAEFRPRLVLMDLGLPDRPGLEVGRAMLERQPTLKIVALTAVNEGGAVRDAIRSGFGGYLTKDTPITAFADALRTALGGSTVLPPRLVEAAAGMRSPEEEDARLRARHLTAREKEVLALLVAGAGSDGIAAKLSVSPHTVRTHVQNILTKLQVRSRLEAAAFAVRFGLVEFPSTRR